MSRPLIIFHHGCADGFTAAWAAWLALGNGADYVPGVYQEAPPDVTGRDVIMVDFSFKRDVVQALRAKAKSIVIIDHHKTAAEDLVGQCEDAPGLCPIDLRFDMAKSGAMLAWQYFHPTERAPRLVEYVQDRDLWKWELSFSREFSAALFTYDFDFKTWSGISEQVSSAAGWSEFVSQGEAIVRKQAKDVADLVRSTSRKVIIGGYAVDVANVPHMLASDAGHLMTKTNPFGATYCDYPNGRKFSLRSTDEGPDVSEISKRYGGGGHRNAAGFTMPLTWLPLAVPKAA